VLENILQEVKSTADGNLTEEKHINQLRVLVQLCNNNVKLKFENMISTRTFFKVKEDAFYKIGRAEGKLEGKVEGKAENQMQTVIRLKELGSDTEFISKVLNIPVSEVEMLINQES
jgi:predicted transposase YdaD